MIIEGVVVKGLLLGKKIGFPTINIAYTTLDLPFGIYVSRVHLAEGVFRGALYFGPRFVVGETEPSLEVHLLDFSGDVYGQKVKIEVFDKIRDTEHFDDLDSLKRQIRFDVEFVREYTFKKT